PQGVEGRGAVVDAPMNDSIVPAEAPATFTWHLAGGAGAQGTPGYFLVFSTDTKPELLRVFTTMTSYKPDKKAWATLLSAMVWTKLTIVSADCADDTVVPGSGPFTGVTMEFCIEAV